MTSTTGPKGIDGLQIEARLPAGHHARSGALPLAHPVAELGEAHAHRHIVTWCEYMELIGFVVSTAVLLGSPGPGIIALLAIGSAVGFRRGVKFLAGIQLGLLAAAVLSGVGMSWFLVVMPGLLWGMKIAAALYLLYLAWQIASAPPALMQGGDANRLNNFLTGFALAAINPKVYLALASLFTAHPALHHQMIVDVASKVTIVMITMAVVDAAWLALGAAVGLVKVSDTAQRSVNVALGCILAVVALIGLV